MVNFVFLQSMHDVASLSGIHTAACSFKGCLPAEGKVEKKIYLSVTNKVESRKKKWDESKEKRDGWIKDKKRENEEMDERKGRIDGRRE